MTGRPYLEHLTDADLRLLASAAPGGTPEDRRVRLVNDPDRLLEAIGSPAVYDALFGGDPRDTLLHASPFLAFATLVHRAARDLRGAGFVTEWVGPGQRVPVFDVAPLQRFAEDPARRFFLAQLLASYTQVQSGSFAVRTDRGWRRRRFSELDPVRLCELLEVVPAPARPGVYRRLGDLTLFLSGVFPDHVGGRQLPPISRQRLERALAGGGGSQPSQLSDDPLTFLEMIGRRAYAVAWRAGRTHPGARTLGEVAQEGFAPARRVLNFLTDRYLFPARDRWFPAA